MGLENNRYRTEEHIELAKGNGDHHLVKDSVFRVLEDDVDMDGVDAECLKVERVESDNNLAIFVRKDDFLDGTTSVES